VLELESEPLTKFLQESAFRELLLRQQHNERSRSLMLAYAAGPELDHIGATYYLTQRLVLDEGDPQATPPVSATYESDRDYRRRILLAHDAFSTAGSRESYIYHALGASSDIADVQAVRPIPGRVKVYVMSRDGSGVAEQSLLDVVAAALTDERVRPLSDTVEVASAEIIDFTVSARLQGLILRWWSRRRRRQFGSMPRRGTELAKILCAVLWRRGFTCRGWSG
jgi:phage-related baseplate assembly protein